MQRINAQGLTERKPYYVWNYQYDKSAFSFYLGAFGCKKKGRIAILPSIRYKLLLSFFLTTNC